MGEITIAKNNIGLRIKTGIFHYDNGIEQPQYHAVDETEQTFGNLTIAQIEFDDNTKFLTDCCNSHNATFIVMFQRCYLSKKDIEINDYLVTWNKYENMFKDSNIYITYSPKNAQIIEMGQENAHF